MDSARTYSGERRKAADWSRKCLTALTTFPRPLELVIVAVVNVDYVRVSATHVPVRQDHKHLMVRFAPRTLLRGHNIPFFRFVERSFGCDLDKPINAKAANQSCERVKLDNRKITNRRIKVNYFVDVVCRKDELQLNFSEG
jgi:hypothetical protein